MLYTITVTALHPTKNQSGSVFAARWVFLIDVDEGTENFTKTTCNNDYDIPQSQKLIFVNKPPKLLWSKVHAETPDYVIYFEQEWGSGNAISFIFYEGVELFTSLPKPYKE